MFEHVFAPIRIRECGAENRIILPAMGTENGGGKRSCEQIS